MYSTYDYAYNGLLYLNNIMRPRHYILRKVEKMAFTYTMQVNQLTLSCLRRVGSLVLPICYLHFYHIS